MRAMKMKVLARQQNRLSLDGLERFKEGNFDFDDMTRLGGPSILHESDLQAAWYAEPSSSTRGWLNSFMSRRGPLSRICAKSTPCCQQVAPILLCPQEASPGSA
ncbi:hypothetical protein KIN20_020733 [Parelaphostrongylus tenuis]|uniref:Uncharacterized protein n=1 Tax=Parelaphostrongylus tenuis TaxID=148309 RepID=A0AAD5MMX2_PARTN|nr:hypothetical protein KIN20_020733 [Parelaphostrongylus tenuis]